MDRQQWRLVVPRSLRWYADLLAVDLVVVAVVLSLFVPELRQLSVWVLVGIPFVLFAPGYALTAALYPSKPPDPEHETATGGVDSPGIDILERVIISVGASLAIVPLVGIVLSFTPMQISLTSSMLSLGGIAVAFTGVAAGRRATLPPEDRFTVSAVREVITSRWSPDDEPKSRVDVALSGLVVVVLLLSAGAVGYTLTEPPAGESFTELSLLTRDANGNLVADGYPDTLTSNEPESFVVGIGNHEGQVQSYSVVVELQRLAEDSETVVEEQELRRFRTQVASNETEYNQLTLTPQMRGERLRLVFLLYKDSPPEDPTMDNAYREVHHWVTVTAP